MLIWVHPEMKNSLHRKIFDHLRKMTEKGKRQIDRIALQRELEEKFIELGGRTYQYLCADESKSELHQDKHIMQLVTGIAELENELALIDKEISKNKFD